MHVWLAIMTDTSYFTSQDPHVLHLNYNTTNHTLKSARMGLVISFHLFIKFWISIFDSLYKVNYSFISKFTLLCIHSKFHKNFHVNQCDVFPVFYLSLFSYNWDFWNEHGFYSSVPLLVKDHYILSTILRVFSGTSHFPSLCFY